MTLAIFGFQQELPEYAPAPVKTKVEKKAAWKRVTAEERAHGSASHRSGRATIYCAGCGKPFDVWASVSDSGWRKNCSVDCANAAKTRAATEDARAAISAAIANGATSPGQVAKACSKAAPWAKQYLCGMRRDGLVVCTRRGQKCVWTLARSARTEAAE